MPCRLISRILSRFGLVPRRITALYSPSFMRTVTVLCPFCGENHKHVWNERIDGLDGSLVMAVRSADCGGGEYVIEVPRGS